MSHVSRQNSRNLSLSKGDQMLPAPSFFRKGHVVTDTDGNVVFTGLIKVNGTEIPSISKAKAFVRVRKFKQYELRVVKS